MTYVFKHIKDASPPPTHLVYKAPKSDLLRAEPLKDSVDLRPVSCPIYNQGSIGSCTANAIAFLFWYAMKTQYKTEFQLSRLFQYYWSRWFYSQQSVLQDTGARISDAMKVLKTFGVAPESDQPYVVTKFALPPPDQALTNSNLYYATKYSAVPQDIDTIKSVLARGYPIAFGIQVYSSFQSQAANATDVIPMPNTATERLLGGHAVVLVGYDKTRFIVRNSWGTNMQDKGYFYLPYEYVKSTSLSNSFWILESVYNRGLVLSSR